jgi:hypothetical protein
MKSISILGRTVELKPKGKSELKGITIGDSLSYSFYDGDYLGVTLIFIEPKKGNPSPRSCDLTASRLTEVLESPIVFLLKPGPSYERQRLLDKNVYFVMSDKYAHLPMLVANERARRRKSAERLTPVAQYILLYHLQVKSLEGFTAKDMTDLMPYSYESISLGITCLADVGLCKKNPDGPKRKVINFLAKGHELWQKAQTVMINPVEKRIYCDQLHSGEHFASCSINALAHYTWLNPDHERMILMNKSQLKELQSSNSIVNINEYDGDIMIEVWKYPPVVQRSENVDWADKLSLALSLEKDDDPRVEGEVQRMMNEMTWKD